MKRRKKKRRTNEEHKRLGSDCFGTELYLFACFFFFGPFTCLFFFGVFSFFFFRCVIFVIDVVVHSTMKNVLINYLPLRLHTLHLGSRLFNSIVCWFSFRFELFVFGSESEKKNTNFSVCVGSCFFVFFFILVPS